MLRHLLLALLAVPLLAGEARSAADPPSVARPHLVVGDQNFSQGLVYFLRVGAPPGVAAVGTAHAFELDDLVEARMAVFTLGRGTKPIATANGLLVAPGRPFNATGASLKDDYVVYIGRANPDKGPVEAIRIARQAGRPLKMILKRNEPPELAYFEHEIQPLLGHDVELYENVPHAEKADLLGRARHYERPPYLDIRLPAIQAERAFRRRVLGGRLPHGGRHRDLPIGLRLRSSRADRSDRRL